MSTSCNDAVAKCRCCCHVELLSPASESLGPGCFRDGASTCARYRIHAVVSCSLNDLTRGCHVVLDLSGRERPGETGALRLARGLAQGCGYDHSVTGESINERGDADAHLDSSSWQSSSKISVRANTSACGSMWGITTFSLLHAHTPPTQQPSPPRQRVTTHSQTVPSQFLQCCLLFRLSSCNKSVEGANQLGSCWTHNSSQTHGLEHVKVALHYQECRIASACSQHP